jgi:4'-phosphopantetheinyl transferase
MREQIPAGRSGVPAERRKTVETEECGILPKAATPGLQLWCCNLDDPRVLPYCDESVLAAGELQRAGSYRLERHRQLFIRRRALRRFLLGQFLGVSPQSLCLVETSLGKPQLSPSSPERCEFSTSHSKNVFAMAIAPEGEIGVDVEVLRTDWNLEPVAAMYLDRRQIAQLETIPTSERQKQILRFWSLREAFAKASGHGIAQPHDAEIPAARVWDCIFGADSPLPGWNWIQQWHRIGGHDAVISIARKTQQKIKSEHYRA